MNNEELIFLYKEHYDESKGYKFTTYSKYYIEREIFNCIIRDMYLIRVSRKILKDKYNYRFQDINIIELHDHLFLDTFECMNNDALNKKIIEWDVFNLLKKLNNDEVEIINLKYGLNGYNLHSYEEIGKILGVSRTTIFNKLKLLLI